MSLPSGASHVGLVSYWSDHWGCLSGVLVGAASQLCLMCSLVSAHWCCLQGCSLLTGLLTGAPISCASCAHWCLLTGAACRSAHYSLVCSLVLLSAVPHVLTGVCLLVLPFTAAHYSLVCSLVLPISKPHVLLRSVYLPHLRMHEGHVRLFLMLGCMRVCLFLMLGCTCASSSCWDA